jgi:diguanylate cyclase (GGDEF)-like protein
MRAALEGESGQFLAADGQRPLRILLIEDSRADAELLLDILTDELPGAIVEVTATLAEAVPLLAHPLDIAITDLSLPDAQGLDALSAVLSVRPDIAVVVMTGRHDRDLALRALSEGAEDYLVKGVQDARAVATAVLFAAERRGAENRAHRYERLALSLLDAMDSATCAVNRDGTIIAVNRAWREFCVHNGGDPNLSGLGRNYLEVCRAAGGSDARVAQEVATDLRRLLAGDIARFEADYPCHSPTEDRWFSVRANALPESGAVLSHVDLSTMKKAQQALAHLTLHDALTDLPNRQLLNDRVAQALAMTERSDQNVAVAFLDIDQFKRINDSLGHSVGDELLRGVADRLRQHVRSGDTVARFAGDEFVVVWPSIGVAAEAQLLAQRVVESMAAPFVLKGRTVTVTVSIGIAVGRAPQQVDDLLLDADAAMYYAKSHGRGLTRMFTDELRADAAARVRIEAELLEGLDRNEFALHYQPVVDLAAGTVIGVEALIRWNHPKGTRMPDSFIPAAEATGIIIPLGAWVLQEACRQGAEWTAQGLDLQMAVNLSARQVGHPDIIDTIERTILESGLPAERLWVEVTESAVLEDAELARTVFNRIRALGVSVAIDDFGTGYSSLLYLKRYPAAALKADRQFVAGLGLHEDDGAIVASVIGLAHAVGAICVAEGVETLSQYAALAALHCDHAQGYLFSRPVPPEAIRRALQECDDVLAAHPSRMSESGDRN